MSTVQLSKKKRVLCLATLLIASCIGMGDFVVVPIMNDWYVNFGDKMEFVDYAMSGSLIGMIIGAVLAGVLARFMSKKTMLIIAGVLFTGAGFFTMYAPSIEVICVLRTVFGLSFGLIMVAPYPLINEIYEDEAGRSRAIGFFAASQNGWGIIIGVLAGAVGAVDSNAVYYLFLFGIVIIVLVAMFVPNTGKDAPQQKQEGAQTSAIPMVSVVAVCAAIAVAAVAANATTYEVSILVDQQGIGDALLAGTLSSVYMVASLVYNIFFGTIYGKLKRYTSIVSYASLALGLLLIWANPSAIAYYIAYALVGLGWGSLLAYYPMYFSEIIPIERQAGVLGAFNAIQGLGGFFCTYSVTAIITFRGSEMVVDAFPVFTVLAAAGVVLTVILSIRYTRAHAAKELKTA